MKISDYSKNYLKGASLITKAINSDDYSRLIGEVVNLKKRKGRLFILGVGGSAANASHAVNDFRKICNIETHTPVDNIAELTARINDDGWETVFAEWLKTNRLSSDDALLVFSVGGGDIQRKTSANISYALEYAKEKKSTILGIVSRDGGVTKKLAKVCVIIPPLFENSITPYAESFQALLWHGIANYPELRSLKSNLRSTRKFALFINRTGLIDHLVRYPGPEPFDSPQRPKDVSLVNGIVDVIRWANGYNIPVIEISNQPGVAKGKMKQEMSDSIEYRVHQLLSEQEVKVNKSYICPHHPRGVIPELSLNCTCRKPEPGLLIKAAEELKIDLADSLFLGDTAPDMKAGKKAGCQTVILLHNSNLPEKVKMAHLAKADFRVKSTSEILPILRKKFLVSE